MTKNKIIKDSFWNIFDYISTLVIFLITTKILIDKIGVDGYGFYTFFTSLIGTFGLVDLGMGMAVSKYLSEFLHHKKYYEANQVVTIAFVFYAIIGIFLFLVILLFNSNIINFLNFGDKFLDIGSNVLILTSIIFIINMMSTIMINTLVALEEWKKISSINIVLKILNAIVLVYILTLDIALAEKIYYIFLLLLGFSVFKAIIYFFYSKNAFKKLSFVKPTFEVKEKMLKFLKVSSTQYGLSLLAGHLDKFIISKFFGLEALGVYSFVVNAFVYMYGFLTNIFKIFLPKLSKLHGDNNTEELKNNFKRLLIYSFLTSIILGVGSLIIWNPFLGAYISEDFASKSFGFMQLFALYLVVRSAEPIFAYFFNAIAKPSILVTNLAIGTTTTVLGYFVLIPYLDIYGLVTSQIVASIVVYGYNFLMIKRKGFDEFTK